MDFRPILFTCIAFTCIARSAFYIKAFMYNTIHLFNISNMNKLPTGLINVCIKLDLILTCRPLSEIRSTGLRCDNSTKNGQWSYKDEHILYVHACLPKK